MQADRLTNKCVQAETGLTTYDYEMPLNPDDWAKIDGVYVLTITLHRLSLDISERYLKEKYNCY